MTSSVFSSLSLRPRSASRLLLWSTALAACTTGAPPPPLDASAIGAQNQAYAQTLLHGIRSCMLNPSVDAAPGDGDAAAASGIGRMCSCYRGFEPEQPQMHRLTIVVNREGIVRRVTDSASGDTGNLGTCSADALQGTRMPIPPAPTVLEIRLSDVFIRPAKSKPAENADKPGE